MFPIFLLGHTRKEQRASGYIALFRMHSSETGHLQSQCFNNSLVGFILNTYTLCTNRDEEVQTIPEGDFILDLVQGRANSSCQNIFTLP